MGYYLDGDKITLDELQKKILDTDLVPSRSVLKEDIEDKFLKIKECSIDTLESLRRELKTSKKIPKMAERTGVDSKYLTLLRREIESFFPKTFPINKFDWFPDDVISKLTEHGYKNSEKLYTAFSENDIDKMAQEMAIESDILLEICQLVSLVRIQWVSPLAARIMYLAGYTDIEKVSHANAQTMCEKMDEINVENGFFKGKIGLRDIKRLIKAAGYLL